MRPITLDLHGFASFRDEAHVDFTDADFFALVGPTGSGKSTVIDAMTFALYGSVPRWGRKGMVSLALAPSVARGTVKLVFEVAGQRYVVARELRRVGASVNQRAASLERLADPNGLAAPGDSTLPLAKDLDGVNEAVEKLLGLKYEDFTQCVVLPQGQFAAFLHAKPADRQEILLRLLGAKHYRLMMERANSRDKVAAQRAVTYGEELLGFAEATPAAEESARAAVAALETLGDRVAELLPRMSERRDEFKAADGRLRQLKAEVATLSVLRVPDDAGRLDADLAASRDRAEAVKAAEQQAELADTASRDELARGPQRAPLELARAQRAEHTRLHQAIPGLAAGVTEHGQRAAAASRAEQAADAAVGEARVQRDAAVRVAEAAASRVTGLAAEHSRLAVVAVPAEVTALDERHRAAREAVKAATEDLGAADEADARAQAARAALPPEAPLAQAARGIGELRTVMASVIGGGQSAAQAAQANQAAAVALAQAEQDHAQRQAELDAARRSHVVAGLRPHLAAGEPCPVCEQTVATLPPPLTAEALDAAQERREAADRALATARSAAHKADLAASKAKDAVAAGRERQAVLVRELSELIAGPLASVQAALTAISTTPVKTEADPLAAAQAKIAALAQARREADQAAEQAGTRARQARDRHREAQQRAQAAEGALTEAATALRTARDPLVALGAPPADGVGLKEAWTALADWAGQQASERERDLTQARQDHATAEREHQERQKQFDTAERTLADQRAAARQASAEDQRARERLSQVTTRASELGELLTDAPSDEQITERLAHRDQLEKAGREAESALRAARAERAQAETERQSREAAERTARGELSRARDLVVALGAPPVADQGLLDGWTVLVTWAAGEAKTREQDAAAAAKAADAAREGGLELARELSADLARAGIDLAPEVAAASAEKAVAGALEKASAAADRIAERKAQAADLVAKQRDAQAEQQVAHLLGNLLQARQFPQWLVSEALDELVTAASSTLAQLSAGQFDLTHDKGDLFVIDHADADARRSVRTLSGGETFQASLALALALSGQISALAAAGAARLDSIFLDEGFGTLDPETLETVASTLEALAEGDRMVGVVTHVPALAERVPVRFRVNRDARTSTIAREGLGTEL